MTGSRYRTAFSLVLALFALALTTSPGAAHPHVWVTMKTELVYAQDGTLSRVQHAWTFDEMFSSYATQGLPAKTKGQFTREELAALAQTNVDSLKDYRYFTHARIDGKKQNTLLGDPVDYWLDYDPAKTELTLHFTLPVKTPASGQLVLEIYDPEFFVDFGMADKDPVKLSGAPANCTVTTEKPHDESFSPSQRSSNMSELNAGMGMSFANKIAVLCP